MIERDAAIRIVEEQLAREDQEQLARGLAPIPVTVTDAERHELVWIVRYQSAEYVRTGDRHTMLIGNGPYLVDRVDGGLYSVGVVSAKTGAWEDDYRVRVRGQTIRTAVDDLHDEISEIAATRGRLQATRVLRAAVPTLRPGEAVAYVTALRGGEDVPAQLVALANRELVLPLNPVDAVRTVREARAERQTEG